MKIASGSFLGPYEVLSLLGSGGMGEVWRARDTRLGRDVAIKVLPPEYSADPDRLRRFEQEARAAGVLNHPNILSIYDVGTHEGSPFVVSELLEGETLRQRLGTSVLSSRKAIDYALQIARGLAAAHDMGIAHRDLKPENLFVTKDGRVKILDFGLAKLVAPRVGKPDQTNAPTTPVRTESGMVMGTVGYMSPEQVRGQQADHRSDIFSFGSILYEMLSGRRAFRGDSAVETMSAILKDEPPELSETNRALPPGLERVVRHCLEKNREERFQSASDLAFALEALSGFSASGATAVASLRARPRRSAWVGRVALLAAVAAAAFWMGARQKAPAPNFHRLTFRRGIVSSARFAPDGQTIVYSAAWEGMPVELFTTRVGSRESRSLGLPSAEILAVSFSGEMAILLRRGERRTLARVPLAGGAPREQLEDVRYGDFSPDGSALAVIRALPGRVRLEFPVGRVLYETSGDMSHVRVSPKGDLVAFFDHPLVGDSSGSLLVVDRAGKKREISRGWRLLAGLAWAPSGKQLWFSGVRDEARKVWVADLSGREKVVLQAPGRVTLEDIARDGRALLTRDNVRVQLVARAPGELEERNLSWMDWSLLRDLSPDGRTVLFNESGEAGGPDYASYLARLDGSLPVKLGAGSGMALSPEGEWVLLRMRENATSLFLLPTGAGQPRTLATEGVRPQRAGFLPDGKRIYFSGNAPGRPSRLYLLDRATSASRPISGEGVQALYNGASPDGRWIVARSAGKLFLYPTGEGEGPARQIPGLESSEALAGWSADSGALFVYREHELPARVERLKVSTGKREPWKELAPKDPTGVEHLWRIRVTPDGRGYAYSYGRYLMDLYLAEGLK